jgi:hypothetical protein
LRILELSRETGFSFYENKPCGTGSAEVTNQFTRQLLRWTFTPDGDVCRHIPKNSIRKKIEGQVTKNGLTAPLGWGKATNPPEPYSKALVENI